VLLSKHSRRTVAALEIVTHLSDTTLAYLAGMIDGEGSIGVRRRDKPATRGDRARGLSYNLKISIAGEPNHLYNLRQDVGNLGSLYIRKRFGQRHLAEWIIAHGQARLLASRVMPFLRLKRRQVELLLEMPQFKSRWEVTPEIRQKQEAIRLEIKSLNKLGKGR